MNTPAHLALSVFIWRNEPNWKAAAAITLGALLPDLPMVGFYLYQKYSLHTPEGIIWSTLYFEKDWQLLFDVFNSIPAAVMLAALCYWLNFKLGFLLFASALLHMLFDFPLHHDDAHRHFLPLSNWRYISPVSYWDPRHFGQYVVWVEVALTLLGSVYVVTRSASNPMRIIAGLTLFAYLGFSIFVFFMWR